MSLLQDILNNKVNTKQTKSSSKNSKKSVVNDVINNRINTEPEQPDNNYSQSIAARLATRSRVNATLGEKAAANSKMYDFSVSRTETEALRAYDKKQSATNKYWSAVSEYIKNPTRENKDNLNKIRKEKNKASDEFTIARSQAQEALAQEHYENANPLYKAAVKLAEPLVNPVIDLTSTLTTKKVKDAEGKEKYVDTTGFNAIHKAVTKDDGTLLSKGYNVYNAVVSTAGKMAAAGATLGPTLYYGDMFTDKYKEDINKGQDKTRSAVDAAYTTAMGVVIDKVVGVAGKLVGLKGNTTASATEELVNKGWSKLIKNPNIAKIVSGATVEGLSEGVEEFADNIGSFFILNQDNPRTLESFGKMLYDTIPDALYSTLVGTIIGAGTNTVENLDPNTRKAITSKETKQSIDNAIEGFKDYKPDTIESAQAKESIITKLEETRDIVNSLSTEEQTAPNRTEQQEKTKVEQTTKKVSEQKETKQTDTKQKQLDIIEKNNKMTDEQHTGIREVSDIKTAEEAFKTTIDEDEDYSYPDFTKQDGEKALESGKITVYSSKPIEQGGFVSPSKMMAQDYAGDGKVYSQEVNVNDVAWINSDEGQYAKIEEQPQIISSTEKKKEGQLQFDLSDKTTELINKTKKTADKIDLPKKQTEQTIATYKNINTVENNSSFTNYLDGNITYTDKGIKTTFDEKMVKDVIRITQPNDHAETITISAYGKEFKMKKPSPEIQKKSIEEQVNFYSEKLSNDEKIKIKEETNTKIRDYEAALEFAKKTGNKNLEKLMNNLSETEVYKARDISSELFKQILEVGKDADDFSEKFNKNYLDDMVGSKDKKTPNRVSPEQITKGQALFFYNLEQGNMNEAIDNFKKVKRYGTTSSQALTQMRALYQTHPLGIWIEYIDTMDNAFEEMANRKGIEWRKKNDPMTNPDSKFKVKDEDSLYILKKSIELYNLHATDYDAYNAKKGELQQFIGDRIPISAAKQLSNWVRSSLLLGPRTVLKNNFSNYIDTAYHAINKINYSIVDKITKEKYKTNTTVAGISIQGVAAGGKAFAKTSVDTAKNAFYNLTHGTSISGEYNNKYTNEEISKNNFTKDFFNTMPNRYQTKLKLVNKNLNVLSQLSNDVMTWGDAKFAASSYADNNITLRIKNALEQHNKNPNKNLIYNQVTDNSGTTHIYYVNTDGTLSEAISTTPDKFIEKNNMEMVKHLDEIDEIATKYSEARTYVGDTTMSKTTSAILKTLNNAAAKVPLLKQTGIEPTDFVVPYSKIGSNLAYRGYRGSIFAFPHMKEAFNNFKQEVETSKIENKDVNMDTQFEFVSRLGDIITGTEIYLVIGSMAIAAFNAVGGDKEDDEDKKSTKVKKFMQTVFGQDEYTFKIGDYNVKFDVGGNLTNMLKTSLDLTEMVNEKDTDFVKYVKVGLGDLLSEWTMSNVTDLFNNEYNEGIVENIFNVMAKVPSMMIPNFFKDIAVQVDNFTDRSIWDDNLLVYTWNNLKAKLPGLRGTLPEKTDSWGNTMKTGGDLISQYWNNYVSSGMIKKDQSDGISQELMRMYTITQKSSVIPKVNESSFSYKKTTYKLNDKEEKQYLKTYADTAYKQLDKLFYSSEYQNADTDTKLKYIGEVYEYANDVAKKEYLKTKDIDYYNYGQKVYVVGEDITFKDARIIDAIDNNISYEAAGKHQEDGEKFKFYNSFNNYDFYTSARNNIQSIQKTYSKENGFSDKERKDNVINYVNSLNLTSVQKAALIKTAYPASYTQYNEQIKEYLQKQNLDANTYTKLVEDLGLNKTKKNK